MDSPPTIEALLEHREFVRSLARRLLTDEASVDDVMQQTWLTALERPPQKQDALRAWLAQVASNAARKRLRTEARLRRREREGAQPERTEATSEVVERLQVQHHVVEAVLDLREPYRTAVLLRYDEGLPPREIAERTSTSVETVKSRLKRGLRMLREAMDARNGGRERWLGALVPFAFPELVQAALTAASAGHALGVQDVQTVLSGSATTSTSGVGGVLSPWLLAGLLLVGGGSIAWWWQAMSDSERDAGRTDRAATTVSDGRDASHSDSITSTAVERQVTTATPVNPRPTLPRGSLNLDVRFADGTPADDVGIQWQRGDEAGHVVTRFDGRCTVDGVTTGEVLVFFDRGGHRALSFDVGSSEPHLITLSEGVDVHGIVVDGNDLPIAQASIWLSAPNDPTRGRIAARTDDAGHFALRAVDPWCWLGAEASGFVPTRVRTPRTGKEASPPVRFVLGDEGAALHGTSEAYSTVRLYRPPMRAEWEGEVRWIRRPVRTVQADADGTFHLADLAPGPVYLTTQLEGDRRHAQLYLSHEQPAAVAWNEAPRGAVVVDSPSDSSITVLPWFFERATHDAYVPTWTAQAEHGVMKVAALPPGRYQIRRDGRREGALDVTVRSGTETSVRFGSAPATVVLRGRLVDDAGAPRVGWGVEAWPDFLRLAGQPVLRTDENGAFALAPCRADIAYDLAFREPADQRITLLSPDVFATEQVQTFPQPQSLQPDGWITGRIVGDEGQPLTLDVRVALHRTFEGEPWIEETVQADGHVRLGPLLPGRYRIVIHVEGRAPFARGFVMAQSGTTEDFGTIESRPSGSVEVRLRPDRSVSVARATVQLYHFTRGAVETLTRNGLIAHGDAAPGQHYAVLIGDGIACQAKPVDLRPNRTRTIRLPVRRGVPVTFHVAPPAGSPRLRWCRISVRDEAGDIVTMVQVERAAQNAWTTRLHFAPGTYEIDMDCEEGRRTRHRFEVSDEGPNDIFATFD